VTLVFVDDATAVGNGCASADLDDAAAVLSLVSRSAEGVLEALRALGALAFNPFGPAKAERLRGNCREAIDLYQRFIDSGPPPKQVEAPDAILLRSHKLAVSELGANLKAVARAGAGVNNIPVSVLSERGIPVFNTPGANANAVKELVLCAMLLASRGIVPGLRYVETLAGMTDVAALNATLEQEKKRFAGQELAGRTLGVVGLGDRFTADRRRAAHHRDQGHRGLEHPQPRGAGRALERRDLQALRIARSAARRGRDARRSCSRVHLPAIDASAR